MGVHPDNLETRLWFALQKQRQHLAAEPERRALRRLEDRGLVRAGRFVRGFVGEQFATEAAIDQFASARSGNATGKSVSVAASDPLNLSGTVLLAGERIPVRSDQRIELPA